MLELEAELSTKQTSVSKMPSMNFFDKDAIEDRVEQPLFDG